MTIEVKNTPKQDIEIFVEESRQGIDVINTSEQKIDIREQNGSQDIGVDNAANQDIKFEQDIIIVPVYKDAPEYEGDYEVTPKVIEQTLPTERKLLLKDVTIRKIPYFEVSNNAGGDTVYIGNEV